MSERRCLLIVLDGVGVGAAPDATAYGDAGSNTIGNVATAVGGLDLPNLADTGLGNIATIEGMTPIAGVAPQPSPRGAWGVMEPRSAGKDSTTGHWEIAGVHLERAFPTYPSGFPPQLLKQLEARTGRGIIGNIAASGTAVLDQFGPEHERTGAWIVYTSADSVFQIAAHESVVPVQELWAACEAAREILVPPHDVSRVIARPFEGKAGAYRRTANRRDFSILPPEPTLLDALADAGIPREGIGKVDDLFARRSLTSRHTSSNAEGLTLIQKWLGGEQRGLCFVNLVDFDQQYGHRNDVAGFYRALREFDDALPTLLRLLREDDLLLITADHGNDPTTPSTDHARECVPVLAAGPRVRPRSIGRRRTFSDLGATVAEWFGVAFRGRGTSFLPQIT